MLIGYHSSQEQFHPTLLLECACLAEKLGFDSVMTADHFNPWSERQGHSASTWTWLGAAMQATQKINFGSLAIPGGWRYHPAVLAQSISTLCSMYPGRFTWIAAGSGQALNEQVVARGWPSKEERNKRLREGVRIMRALFRGEMVNDETGLIPVREARLWTRADTYPQIFIPALTEETAKWGAEWADGLITINQDEEKLRAIVKAFRENGGRDRPVYLQLHLSWHPDEDVALENAYDQWRSNALTPELSENLNLPHMYDSMATQVRKEDMHDHVKISADLTQHVRWIREFRELGFDGVYLHNVGRNQEEFLRAFAGEVLPACRR